MRLFTLLTLSLVFSIVFSQRVDLTTSHLPIFMIDTDGQTIPDEPKITANLKVVYNGFGQTNSVHDNQFHYDQSIGIEVRGNSSQSFDQLQYGFETRFNGSGENFNFALLDLPEENDWVLYAPYNDVSMIRNIVAYHLWDEMGHWAPRTRLCEVLLNGEYQGIYVLIEKIKLDKNRVKTANLKYEDTTGVEITGGYIMKIDAENNAEDEGFVSQVPGIRSNGQTGNVNWLYHDPKPKNLHPKQKEYIKKYIDTVELVIQSPDFADPENGYAKYISIRSFIDYFIHTEVSQNADGFKRSAYFYKEKLGTDGSKGKLKAGSVWDYNLAYGNGSFCNANKIDGWVSDGCETLPTPVLWKRLMEDPNFENAVRCRFNELRNSIYSDEYLHTLIDSYANDSIGVAQERHFTQWDDLLAPKKINTGGWTWGGSWLDNFNGYRIPSYAEEMDTLKQWLTARLEWIDNNLGGECIVTDVKPLVSFDEITVFPNPTQGSVSIDSKQSINAIDLFTIHGEKIATYTTGSAQTNFVMNDFENLPSGIYCIKISTEGKTIVKKIIKQD